MRQTPQSSDGDLLRRMRAGEEEAFLALYRAHQGMVYRFALQMSGSTEIAEEVTQEVFLSLMRDHRGFDPARGPLAAYLYGIARNLVLRALEREQPYSASIEDPDSQVCEVAAPGPDVLGELTRAETIEILRRAILALPALYREVVVLCELHELDYEEAALALNCPVGTIRSRLHRARAMLAYKLKAAERCPA